MLMYTHMCMLTHGHDCAHMHTYMNEWINDCVNEKTNTELNRFNMGTKSGPEPFYDEFLGLMITEICQILQ